MDGQNWPVVRWLLKAQIALTTATALLTWLLSRWDTAAFVLLGGLAAVLLSGIAALRSFAVSAANDPRAALGALYRGIAIKLIGAAVIFMVAAKTAPQHLPPMVIGFAAATAAYWIALLRAPFPGPDK